MNQGKRKGRMTTAARKMAQKAAADRAGEAARIGMQVATISREVEPALPNVKYPLWIFGPMHFIGERIAQGVAKQHGLPLSPELAAYFTNALLVVTERLVEDFTVEKFAGFRAEVHEAPEVSAEP